MLALGARSSMIIVASVLAALHTAHGQRSHTRIGELDHAVWGIGDGAPSFISSLAQTADGVLWIANGAGLYRFDGVRFERFELPPSQSVPTVPINVIRALPDTSLWIGYLFGGVRVLARGRVIDYSKRDGLPDGIVSSIARDSIGDVWVATITGLARLHNGRWQRMGPEQEYPNGPTEDLLVDRRGAVWIATPAGVFVLPRDGSTFVRQAPSLGSKRGGPYVLPREAPDGSLWAASLPLGVVRLTDAAGKWIGPRAALEGDRGGRVMHIDRRANAWITAYSGRVRVPLPKNSLEHPTSDPTATPPLIERVPLVTGANTSGIVEDREGNIWIATSGGIERFRETKLTPVSLPSNVRWPAIVPAVDGSVWVASDSQQVSLISDRIRPYADAPRNITFAYRDLAGGVWFGSPRGMWHAPASRSSRAVRFMPVALPYDPGTAAIRGIARTLAGDLWVSMLGATTQGVFRQRGGVWSRAPLPPGFSGRPPTTLVADSVGRVWLGYASRLVVVVGDSTRVYSESDGLHVGSVWALRVSGPRLWIGGTDGLVMMEGGRFHTIAASEAIRNVTGIVETADGDVWFNGADGVTHIPAAEVHRAVQDSGYRAHAERFGRHDGLNGQPVIVGPRPTAIQGTDGRLWFTTSVGIAWIDPANITRNRFPPPVQVRALSAGGKTYDVARRVSLPVRTTQLQVVYTALNLATPDRVRFRYRLTDVDTTWVEAGTRREAYYTNLKPGSYRFRVVAANEDGLWNDAGSSIEFDIPPSFTQTKTFEALIVAALVGAAWLVALWRQRQMARALQIKFEGQLAERARVARELHDTLLGDITGVGLQLRAAAARAGSANGSAPVVELLSSLSTQVQATLVEARRSVSAIRTTPDELLPLHEQLKHAAQRTFGETGITARVEHTGAPRTYSPKVESQIVGIASEAMSNARRHAECQSVTITCTYARRDVHIRVRDDGRGFDSSQATPDGHWGIVGMRERAALIGATLSVTSAAARGTEVLLVAPAGARE